MTKFFKKNYFGGHFGPFSPKFEQKLIFLKQSALLVFKYSNYLSTCRKSEKKQWSIPEKNAELIDRQSDNGDFTIGPSVGQGFNKPT